jgi:hypothetical protein
MSSSCRRLQVFATTLPRGIQPLKQELVHLLNTSG